MDRGAWWATVHGVSKESDTTERLNSNNPPESTLCTGCIHTDSPVGALMEAPMVGEADGIQTAGWKSYVQLDPSGCLLLDSMGSQTISVFLLNA